MALDDRFKGSLYQGVEKPSLLSRVGTALQGFGAGDGRRRSNGTSDGFEPSADAPEPWCDNMR